ncbi:hypothetical protein Ddc_18899 [Ditylenchus destructor]|nr:hypothetical protein Ddc_18899 [Ditylenchus destructor]
MAKGTVGLADALKTTGKPASRYPGGSGARLKQLEGRKDYFINAWWEWVGELGRLMSGTPRGTGSLSLGLLHN